MADDRTATTPRTRTHLWEAGAGEPVLFVHGNLSNGAVWREQLDLLPAGVRGLAPDLRGYGASEPDPVDATRGVRDYSDDLLALLDVEGLDGVHVVGHSLGGVVALQLALDAPDRVRSLVLVAPVSHHGYGGTRRDGTPWTPDYAGSGGGAANPDLVRLIAEGDRSAEHQASPRNVVRALFFPDPEAVREEELLLDGILESQVGDGHYPGDAVSSPHWPHVAPGVRGVLNAVSPKHLDLSAFAAGGPRVPVLWVRGTADAIISDAALTDLGNLGKLGVVPDWPGDDVFGPQPMVSQTRHLLDRYAARGGQYRELAWEGVGHFPQTQRPDEFAAALATHLGEAGGGA